MAAPTNPAPQLNQQVLDYLIAATTNEAVGIELWNAINLALDSDLRIGRTQVLGGQSGNFLKVGPSGLLSQGSGGGGQGTFLPDGSTVSGSYDGDVICGGTLTLSGDLTVTGDLVVNTDLVNQRGYGLTVYGDLIVKNHFAFTPTGPVGSQGNVLIYGDFVFGYGNFNPQSGFNPYLEIGGDFTSNNQSSFDGSGAPETQGLNIYVGGDLDIEDVYLQGGDSAGNSSAGSGGYLYVSGDCFIIDYLNLGGGNSSYAVRNAGNGGQLYCYGDATLYTYASGGTASNDASGGYGGDVEIYGDLIGGYVQVNGGDCGSSQGNHSAGRGGYCYIGGDVIYGPSIQLNGGTRYGVITGGGGASSPDGGNFYCAGGAIWQVICNGGQDISTNPTANAGSGGSIYFYAPASVNNSLVADGGNGGLNGGNGGYIQGQGSLDLGSNLEINGGNNDIGTNGSVGTARVAGLTCTNVYMQDGSGIGAAPVNTGGLYMMGSVFASLIYATNRDAIQIVNQFYNNWPCTLLIEALGPKTVFTNPNGSNTGDVSSFIGNSIFFCTTVGGWKQTPGTSL